MSKKISLASWIILSSLTFLLFSCGTVMKTIVGLPVLNVYTSDEIAKNIAQLPAKNNVMDITLHDEPEKEVIEDFIYKSILYRAYVYNEENKLMCYNGNTSCAIDELADLREKTIEANYDNCNPSDLINDLMNLEYILDQLKYSNDNNLLDSKY